jgi:hypothetical protein
VRIAAIYFVKDDARLALRLPKKQRMDVYCGPTRVLYLFHVFEGADRARSIDFQRVKST